MEKFIFLVPLSGLLALIFALFLALRINKAPEGTDRMKEIAGNIHEGAMAFLTSEYKILVIFAHASSRAHSSLYSLASLVCKLQPRQMSEQPMPQKRAE